MEESSEKGHSGDRETGNEGPPRLQARGKGAVMLTGVRLFVTTDCSPSGSSVHGISQQEYWSGLPFPSPGDLPDPGIAPVSCFSPALGGGFFFF